MLAFVHPPLQVRVDIAAKGRAVLEMAPLAGYGMSLINFLWVLFRGV